jgi:hypothetical protein
MACPQRFSEDCYALQVFDENLPPTQQFFSLDQFAFKYKNWRYQNSKWFITLEAVKSDLTQLMQFFRHLAGCPCHT